MARRVRLLVDLGATWLRAELIDDAGTVIVSERMRSGGVAEILDHLRGLLLENELTPAVSVLGVPGRVIDPGGVAQLTYLGEAGEIDFREVLGDAPGGVHVVNDLAAGVRGIETLAADALRLVQGPRTIDPAGLDAFALLMPGTGLGVGLGGARLRDAASEAGNALAAIDFKDDDEVAAAFALRATEAPLSYEDLTRAGALETIAGALADPASSEAEAFLAAVAEAPLHRRPYLLLESAPPYAGVGRALRVQARLLARAAQTVALTVLPDAVFVGGNYLTAAWTYMERPFREAFRRGAAHEAYLASVPVWYTDAADLNLRGLRALSHTL